MKDLLTNLITILPILFPVCAGILIAVSERKGEHIHSFSKALMIAVFIMEACLSALDIVFGSDRMVLFSFTDLITAVLKKDLFTQVFNAMTSCVFLLTGIYATDYMRHDDMKTEEEQKVKTLLKTINMLVY